MRASLVPLPGAPGPFALSDEAVLRKFATDAGLEPIEVFDVDSPWIYADKTAALRALTSTGNAAKAMAQIDEEVVTQAYAKAFAPFRQSDGGYRVSAWFRCLASLTRKGHWARRYADAGEMKDIARSASAVMVSAGFTPGLAEMAEPSIT